MDIIKYDLLYYLINCRFTMVNVVKKKKMSRRLRILHASFKTLNNTKLVMKKKLQKKFYRTFFIVFI